MNKIDEAKQLLEQNGYLVAGPFTYQTYRDAFLLKPGLVAFHLDATGQFKWMKPRDLCEAIDIERHTLTRHLKQKDCPKVKQHRGPKGRLRRLQPTRELVRFLTRNK